MIHKRSLPALILLLTQTSMATATTVHYCIGERGEPSYTFSSCDNGEAGRPLRAWNPPPGSVTPRPVPGPRARADTPPPKQPPREPTIARATMPRHEDAQPAVEPAKETKPGQESKKKTKKKPVRYTPWR